MQKNVEELRGQITGLNDQLRTKELTLEEALAREGELNAQLDQQRAQIEVIRGAVGALQGV